MNMRILPLTLALAAAFAGAAEAQSLVQLYEAAKRNDANFKAANALYQANLAKADQAKALIRPTVGLGLTASQSDFDSQSPVSVDARYGTRAMNLNASQPLFRMGNWAGYQQGFKQMDLALAQLKATEQDLMVRGSQAYFDVLVAEESLRFVKAQKIAVAEQLAAAKRNFEVGTSTITDTREAQARFDLVTAQEIAAENDLRVKKLALDDSVGMANAQPIPLQSVIGFQNQATDDVDSWLKKALDQSPLIAQNRIGLEIAQLEIDKAKSGNLPTVDLTASFASNRFPNSSPPSNARINNNTATLGVTFNLPLYTGQATQNRIQEALALQDKARFDLEVTQRSVVQATRTAFYGVQSGLGQVKALEAAEASSQSALDANKLGYQVGVRINIDVLNSQSQLFQTKRDLAKARYDVLMGQLKLRQAAGLLEVEDLVRINALMQP